MASIYKNISDGFEPIRPTVEVTEGEAYIRLGEAQSDPFVLQLLSELLQFFSRQVLLLLKK
jgi:hypothetical protein